MKKFLVVLVLFMFASNSLYAEQKTASKPLTCDDMDKVISELTDTYGETLLLIGKSAVNTVVFYTYNSKTTTWTVIEVQDKLACVLSTGTGIEINKEFFPATKFGTPV